MLDIDGTKWLAKIASGMRTTMFVIGISASLILVVNLAAYWVLSATAVAARDTVLDHVIGAESPIGAELLKRVFGVASDDQAFERLKMAPSFEMHPGLQFMTQRVRNRHYTIGIEGIRYDAGWTDQAVSDLLASRRELVFLMGGSTTLGHGVSGNETISSFLNGGLLGGRAVALNFGSQAYDMQRVVEKLAYLLRSGLRPAAVVILGGWNDVQLFARSNMRWQDKVVYHAFSANRGEIAFTPGASDISSLRLLAESLPVTRLLRARNYREYGIDRVERSRDPFRSGFDFTEAHWMFRHWEQYAERNKAELERQFLESFRKNVEFANGLSHAFGFKLLVVFQPMGFFEQGNPFVPASAAEQSGYKFVAHLRRLIREEIAAGRLGAVDGSNVLDGLKEDRYIDIAHYSPRANAALARFIADRLKTASPAR